MKTAYSYIRFSSARQELGDSLRRQIEGSKTYAERNGLVLDDTLNMQDLGLSAYKGKHREVGALGEFLKLVKEGRIEKGSILIVESVDRLTRENNSDALTLFLSIINHGIELVTLDTYQKYTREEINENPAKLYFYIGEMIRANRESENKSMRLKQSWVNKRNNAINGKQKLTGRVPQWIQIVEGKFTLIPEIVETIELIYKKRLSGIGKEKIVQELNASPNVWKPPKSKINKTGGWQKSTVTKLLSNRALIGEYQLYKLEDGKRVKIEGEVIPNYFPIAIDETLFYEVQELINLNSETAGNGGGKTGKANNVFAHVARCGLCGGVMHHINKGYGSKGRQYLHCDNSRRKKEIECTAKRIRYDEFEKLFFDNFEELDVDAIMGNDTVLDTRLSELKRIVSSYSYNVSVIDSKIEKLKDFLLDVADKRVYKSVNDDLSKLFDEKERLEKTYIEATKEIGKITRQKANLKSDIKQSVEVYKLLDSVANEQEKINLRLRLRSEIKKLVEWIKIYPLQESYTPIEEIEQGIYKTMKSKFIDKVKIKFNGSKNLRLLYLKSFGEVVERAI